MKQKMIKVDPEKILAFCKGTGVTKSEIGYSIGKSSGYINNILKSQQIPEPVYDLLCRVYDLEEGALKADPPCKDNKKLQNGGVEVNPYPLNRTSYWIDLADNGDHVVMRLMLREEEVYKARAFVRNGEDGTEMDLIQAISYAAHMIYKIAQQKLAFTKEK